MLYNSFYEIQFPTDISYGITGGPEFFTDVVTSSSGFEQRNINWRQARNRYNVAQGIKTKEQLDKLISFFRLTQGKAIGFRFKDWTDYQIIGQEIVICDGIKTNFEVIKQYNYGEYNIDRKITKLVTDTVQIYCNEELITPKIDFNLGQIKFDSPPPSGSIIKLYAEFDVPVRFDSDHLATSIEQYGVYSHMEISLVEIKL
jgi:uncharacterized protein (TIGR02217 family)